MKALILAAYIVYLPFQLRAPVVPFGLTNIFLALLAVIYFSSMGSKQTELYFRKPLTIFLVIWFFSFLYSYVFPGEFDAHNILLDFKRLYTLVLGYFVFSTGIKSRRELNFLFIVFLVCTAAVGFYTWKSGMLAGSNFADFKRSSGPFAPPGDWGASDIAGSFLALFVPFLFSFVLFGKDTKLRLGAAGGAVLCVLGIFATYSRGSMMAGALALAVNVFFAIRIYAKKTALAPVVVVIALAALGLTWERWVPDSIVHRTQGTFVDEEGSLDESSAMRFEKWSAGLERFYSSPIIGVGFSKSKDTFGELKVDAHNSFITILSEMGVFGFLAFLLFLFAVVKDSYALAHSDYAHIGVGFAGCIASLIVINMFYGNFFRDTVIGSFWVVLGMLAAARSLSQSLESAQKN